MSTHPVSTPAAPTEAPDNGVGCGALVRRLANDVARCDGSGSVEDGVQYWREGCEHCLRRTAPRPEHVWMMAPPPIIAFECEYLIEPNVPDQPRLTPGKGER